MTPPPTPVSCPAQMRAHDSEIAKVETILVTRKYRYLSRLSRISDILLHLKIVYIQTAVCESTLSGMRALRL